jgi:hypothetical protein
VMGRVSPGMCGGPALISSARSSRARATGWLRGRSRVTVIVGEVAGDGAGEAADDGFAGDGAVFVVVAQVGVEVAR